MIHFIDKVLENLQAYVPLMQSLVWPIVVIVTIYVFRSDIRAFIDAIRKRIVAGGGIKAGPLELPSMIPATVQEQAKKLENEVSEEALTTTATEEPKPTPSSRYETMQDIKEASVLAEDLVMKKLSSELNLKNIDRHVKTNRGPKYIFDGIVIEEQKLIVIEVKFLSRAIHAKMIIRRTLDRLNTYYTSMPEDAKRDFNLILAIVIHDGNPEDVMQQMIFVRETYQFPTHILCYRLKELKEEFGI